MLQQQGLANLRVEQGRFFCFSLKSSRKGAKAVSLREQWNAARVQRQQEVLQRQQQVLEQRQEIQAEMAALHEYQRTMLSQYRQNLAAEMADFLMNTTANRLAMAAALRESLSNFHSLLQAEVATFLEETRSHQQEVWLDQAQQRAAYVAAVQDYVWGTTPTAEQTRSTERSKL